MSFCSLIKGITPKICRLCFDLVNSVLLNLLSVWISVLQSSEQGAGKRCGECDMSVCLCICWSGVDVVKVYVIANLSVSESVREFLDNVF